MNIVDHLSPPSKIRLRRGKPQFSENHIRKIMSFQHQRRLVQHRDGDIFDYAVRLDVAEQGDFFEYAFFDRLVRPQHDYVRLDSKSLKVLD